ncbi:hypothetical protein MMC25_000361 [Agyrium rufum]|nr:hypothetical protein [Agyrium rufum]
MKFSHAAIAITTASSFVAAQPHKHHNRHGGARRAVDVVEVPGPTVVVYKFNGETLTTDQVCEGIKDGSLEWADGSNAPAPCGGSVAPSSSATPTPVPSSTSSAAAASSAAGNEFLQAPAASSAISTSSVVVASSSAAASPSAAPKTKSTSSSSSSSSSSSGSTSGYNSDILDNTGVDKPFPDGTINCSEFPSEYGPIRVDWQGLHGWTAVQYITYSGDSVSQIDTAVPSQSEPFCANQPGKTALCSYACTAGYQKSQWPETQGSTGQSIGGLMCGTDGKLYRTNTAFDTLCIEGVGNVEVENQLEDEACICRTDYPGKFTLVIPDFDDAAANANMMIGDEGETVPLAAQPGTTSPLTVPNEGTYYKHLNMPTSAQYYVNNKGIPVDQACNWSTDGSNMGNWAPMTIGAGQDESGNTWLSLMTTQQNFPTSYKPLDYVVELQGDFGGDTACFYTQDSSGTPWYCSKGSPESYSTSDCVTYDGSNVPGVTVSTTIIDLSSYHRVPC